MEKLNLNKLIANDIINYGMDNTLGTNYIVSLDTFLKDYDDETINYVKSHLSEIKEGIEQNENVADLVYDEKRQEFDMVFYFDGLLTPLEKRIYDTSKVMGYEFEIDEIRNISYEIENSEMYDCMIHDQISEASLNNGREL